MKTILFLTISFLSTLGLYAQPASLDASFDPNGGFNNSVNVTAIQPDGKIIVGGLFSEFNGIGINRIARLNTDGSLDVTFNPWSGFNGTVLCIGIQSDGKIVVGGTFSSFNGVFCVGIARLNGDGSLDTSFDAGIGFSGTVRCVVLQSDGKIIVGGAFSDYNGFTCNNIARLNTDGSFDSTFNFGTGFNNSVYTTAIQPDGKVIVGGSFTAYNGISKNRIIRLNTSGIIDFTFDVGLGFNDVVNCTAMQSDGKIIVGGWFTSYDGASKNRIVRLNNDGTIDIAFDSGSGFDNRLYSIAIQSDGKIIAGGLFTNYNLSLRYFIARLNANGSLDTDFDSGSGFNNWVNSIGIQADNRLIVGGVFTTIYGTNRNRVARLINCSPSTAIEQVEACSSYIWIDGITYTSSTNTPTYVLPNSAGCDSTVTLHLTINQPSIFTMNETACESFTLNNVTYTQSGTYAQQLTNIAGCDSTIVLNLTIPTINTIVTQNQSTLTSAESSGTYQWLDCATMTPMAGETSQIFTATQDGIYAVIVSENGCSDTSDCIEVDVLGLQHYDLQTDLMIAPNPSAGFFTGEFSHLVDEPVKIIILDQTGRIVDTNSIPAKTKTFVLNLLSLQSGVYSLCLYSPTSSCVKRLILEQ